MDRRYRGMKTNPLNITVHSGKNRYIIFCGLPSSWRILHCLSKALFFNPNHNSSQVFQLSQLENERLQNDL
jgi:hypothetical protein